jgi:hypothetical protein
VNELFKRSALHWLRLNTLSTVYAAVGLTSGAVTALVILVFFPTHIWTAFCIGFFLPTGPVYLYAASNRSMTRRLLQIKQWKDDDLIGTQDYERMRSQVIGWYLSRVSPSHREELLDDFPSESREVVTPHRKKRDKVAEIADTNV